MWINVQFFDEDGTMVAERGAYDEQTATPNASDTVMYEIVLGIDEATAQAVGLTAGPTHHVAFCNVIYKDNRIPPRGFTNEEFERISAPVVGAGYSDGQYWDDVAFVLPQDAVRAAVAVYFKTASTKFIQFLRDANHTNDAGLILYEQWEATGKSPPEEMIAQETDLAPFNIGDFTGDSLTTIDDVADFVNCLAGPDGKPAVPSCRSGDLNSDDAVDLGDAARFFRRFGSVE